MIQKITDANLIDLTDYKVSINPFSNIYGYILDNKIVAFIDYNLMYESIELNYIYVDEKYRGNKMATELMNLMINEGKSITLEVSVENAKAIKLYTKFGFEVINIRKGYYNGIDAYLMERK